MASNSTTVYRGNDGRMWVNVDQANKTLAGTDSGIVQNVIIDGITITLPATALGLFYSIRNGGVPPTNGPVGARSDQSVLVTVAPNSSDGITGLGFTATNNKAALNTKATAQVGDELRLIGTGASGTTGWCVVDVKGTWARQA